MKTKQWHKMFTKGEIKQQYKMYCDWSYRNIVVL